MKKGIFIIVLLFVVGSIQIYSNKINTMRFTNIQFDKVDSLMIVAHPDDETIWGGHHLLKGNYLVVCLTSGSNQVRSNEFKAVIKKTNSQGLILNYPDKTNGKRDDWSTSYRAIQKDVEFLIKKKNWTKIVTHNPKGEYGHKHHQMTSEIVSSSVNESQITEKLYYFGKYYSKKHFPKFNGKVPALSKRIHKEDMDKKQELLDLYPSQIKVEKKLSQMMPYENWIPYKEWK